MALSLGTRADFIVRSEIRNMSVECERFNGINLSQGVCDMEVPLPVRVGAQRAIDAGENTYSRHDGVAEFRAAIARRLRRDNGVSYNPETGIVVSAGSTGAFYCACLALLNPGDEVILFEPYYGYHVNTLLAVGAHPTFVTMRPPEWSFRIEDVEKAITPRTRALMLNTPANPSGKVWSEGELRAVAELAIKHDLFIFTDEIYEYFLYDGRRHISPATLPGVRDRTITISGLSKTFSITGWRIGFAACDARWAKTIGYLNDLVYVCAPTPLQLGVAAGLDALEPSYYANLCAHYQVKRDTICNALRDAGLEPYVPQGAYYVLADVSRLPGATSKERAMHLLEKAGIATVPGSAFFRGDQGESMTRFCFAKTDDVLETACERLRANRFG